MVYQIGFIVEQALGHITHGQNLQRNVAQDPSVKAFWGLPAWKNAGLAAKLPVVRSNWTIQAGLQARKSLANISRGTRLDVIFFHTQVTAVFSRDWLRKIPGVVSLDATPRQYDSLGASYMHQEGPAWLEGWKWQLNRDCYRAARHLVTWSQWAKQGLIDEYEVAAEKVSVIPPGVNMEPVTTTRRYPCEEVVRILFVGGDFQRKGGQVLLEAFRRLRWEVANGSNGSLPRLELHLVTREPVAQEAGVFVYNNVTPNSAQLRELYASCQVFCLPTYGDCLPMVLAEAGANAIPLVATPVGAIGEIVRDGETGFLVPAGDDLRLAAVLSKLVGDPELRIRLGERAGQVVRQEHDASRNAARLLKLLKHTANEEKRRVERDG